MGCLEEAGVYRQGKWCLDHVDKLGWPLGGAHLVKRISKSRHFGEVMTDELLAVVDELLEGEPVSPMLDRPQLLFTLPNASQWTVPHNIWHLDMPRVTSGRLSGVQAFVCVDEVPPGGGGTLVVAGSHRFCNEVGRQVSSKAVKRRLKRIEYFKMLMNKDLPDRAELLGERWEAEGIPVEVIELSGAAGDVYFTDMRVLHTLSPNTANRPRIVLTQRFFLKSARDEIMAGFEARATS